MFINFDNVFDIENYIVEIKTGNEIQRGQMQAPNEVVKQQFMSMIQEVSKTSQPIRIRLIRYVDQWSDLEKRNVRTEEYIQFANNTYMKAFEKEFKE